MCKPPSVLEAVNLANEYQQRCCPDCNGSVVIHGMPGNYCWNCRDCDATGFGYVTRAAVHDVVSP